MTEEFNVLNSASKLPEFWMVFSAQPLGHEAIAAETVPIMHFANDGAAAQAKAKELAEEFPGRRLFCLYCSGAFVEARVVAQQVDGIVGNGGPSWARLIEGMSDESS